MYTQSNSSTRVCMMVNSNKHKVRYEVISMAIIVCKVNMKVQSVGLIQGYWPISQKMLNIDYIDPLTDAYTWLDDLPANILKIHQRITV